MERQEGRSLLDSEVDKLWETAYHSDDPGLVAMDAVLSEFAERFGSLKDEVADLVNVWRYLGSEGDPTQANAARNLADQLAAVRKDLGRASVEALGVRL